MSSRLPRIDYLTALCRTVPYNIVERVLADPTERAIQSERFEGSVMFADLVGFTPLCERLASVGPEGLSELGRLLSDLFEKLLEQAIFPYSGYVVHFGGDSCTTVFRGADHALRAAAAALTAQRLMHGEAGRLVAGKSRDLMLRIGLAAGEVRLPILGDLSQRAVLCSGPTAHRALGMQGVAAPSAVVVDSSILGLLAGHAEVVDRHADHAVLRGLHRWPQSLGIEELGDRIEADVEAKITLLEPFVPGPLAGRLMTTPRDWRLEGELRPAVIAFAELWGLDEGQPNMDVAQNVSRSMLRAYRKYGGVLAKADLANRGHRLMIVFGLHRPSENDGERAILAALEAATRLKAFTVANGLNISIRTGIHAGKVFYGAIGSTHKHDITVVGDAVNIAARAAAVAEPFEVTATEGVLGPMKREFEYSARGPLVVKGKSQPIELNVVHSPTEGMAHYVAARRQARFCAGRAAERDLLLHAVDDALGGRARMVGLCGERGTGKSALLSEVIDRWTTSGSTGILGRCRFATNAQPLAPVMSMFASFLGLTTRDSEVDRRERIRTGLVPLALPRGAPELVSLLQPVLRPDGTDEALIDLANSESREAVLGSIVDFVERRLREEPVLYVLEDLHLADSMTLELAVRLSRLPPDLPALFVTTYRPAGVLADFRRNVAVEIELGNVPLASVEELVKNELGAHHVEPELLVFLWQRTQGNPGHVVEIIRFLSERGLIAIRAGVVAPQGAGMELLEEVVPSTLTHVTLARLDELGAVERRLLRMASAIGRRFARPLLARAVDEELQADVLESAIGTLEGVGVIVPSSHEPEGFMFRDAVTRAVAYGTIPEPERRAIHRRIADAMERLMPVGEGPAAAMVGRHRERAGQPQLAAHWYERAARGAMRHGLLAEAADLAARWHAVVGSLPAAERPTKQVTARMALLRFVARAQSGEPGETLRLGRALIAEHKDELDRDARVTLDLRLGQTLVLLGQPEKARVRLRRVHEGAEAPRARADAARWLVRSHLYSRELDEATRWLAEAIALAGDGRAAKARVEVLRGELLAARGDLEAARELFLPLRELARAERRAPLVGNVAVSLGHVLTKLERFDEARALFEEGMGAFRSAGRVRAEAVATLGFAETFLWQGRVEDARAPLEHGLAVCQSIGDALGTAEGLVHLGAAVAWSQDPAAGAAMCEQGCKRALEAGLREAEVVAELHLLRTALLRHDAAAVATALRRCSVQRRHLTGPLFTRRLTELEAQAAELGVKLSTPPLGDS